MIWLRRFFALALVLVFIPSLFLTVVVLRINETFLEPEFWIEELRKADIYNFIYDPLLPAALDEALKQSTDIVPVDLAPLQDDLVAGAREIIPPEWLQEQTETALRTVPPYLLGDVDSFSLTVVIKDRVEAAAGVIKTMIQDGENFTPLYNEVVESATEEVYPTLDSLPFPVPVSQTEMQSSIQRIVPPDWLQQRIGEAIDALTPYITGDADEFAVTIPLADRVKVVGDVLKGILGKAETYDFLVDGALVPLIVEQVGTTDVTVAPGVQLTSDEIITALKQVLSREWVTGLQEELIDQLVAYLTGKSDTFHVAVDLADRKQVASQTLRDLLERRLKERFEALPVCSFEEIVAGGGGIGGAGDLLPSCRPPGFTYEDLAALGSIDPDALVEDALGSLVPDEMVLSEEQLRSLLGSDTVEGFDQIREMTQQGITFTQDDLIDNLGREEARTLDDARSFIHDGVMWTDADLRDALPPDSIEAPFVGRTDAAGLLDLARESIGTSRRLSFLVWLEVALLLSAIGSLGGRRWGSRLLWAAVVLGLAAGSLWAVTGPLYEGFGRPELLRLGEEATQGLSTLESLFAQRGLLFAQNVTDDFIAGLRDQALLLVGIAGLGFVVGVLLQVIGGRSAAAPESPQNG